jgi:integrase
VWLYAAALDFDIGRMPNWTKVIDKTAERERSRELGADEEQRLFDALRRINPDLALMAEFAMLTGQRKKAVVRLRWADVDLVHREAKFTMKTRGETKREHVVPLTGRMLTIINRFPKVARSSSPTSAAAPLRVGATGPRASVESGSRSPLKAGRVSGAPLCVMLKSRTTGGMTCAIPPRRACSAQCLI